MATVFDTPKDLIGKEGMELGVSDWLEIDQERINTFADATGDHQWIHVDPERAKQGPFGAPIAHGYLTMSLVNKFLPETVEVHGISMGVNYGSDKLRFPAPVPVGSRIRGRSELVKVEEVKNGAIQATIRVTVEIEGGDRPACVVDTISRYVTAACAAAALCSCHVQDTTPLPRRSPLHHPRSSAAPRLRAAASAGARERVRRARPAGAQRLQRARLALRGRR